MIIPVVSMSLNWNSLLVGAKQVLGRNVTNTIDNAGIKADSVAAYIAVLGAIKNPTLSARSILPQAGHLLNHGFFSVMTVLPTSVLVELLEISKVSILQTQTVASDKVMLILSGTFSDWKQSIVNGCSDLIDNQIRHFYNECYLQFEKDGLGDIWKGLAKSTLSDATFALK